MSQCRVFVRYESGDHVAVFPTNDAALVNKLGQVLGVDLDVVISLNNLDGNTLRLRQDLDLTRRHMSEVAGLRHVVPPPGAKLRTVIALFPCLSRKVLKVTLEMRH